MMTTLPSLTPRYSSFPPSLTFPSSSTSLAPPPPLPPGPHIAVVAFVNFIPLGSLHNLLHHPLHPPPTWHCRLRLAIHATASLAALNSLQPPINHRDVKPSNLLLADFGPVVRLSALQTLPSANTLGYLDPSYLRSIGLSITTDGYSFGVVLLEILIGCRAINIEYNPLSLVD